jgi:4-hydroxy-tetrahydrodipicolinate synthase
MNNIKLQGCFTALVTPFTSNGEVDYKALKNLVEWQIKSGISGLVPCGTTGESVALNMEEFRRVISTVVETANGRVPVIGGAGGNSTARVIELAKLVQEAGADYILSVCPYYNKPTQEGLYQHFKAIAEYSGLPLVLYNVPGRTAVNMLPETTLRLAEVQNIVAVKEASANLIQIMEIIKHKPSAFSVLSGDDQLALHLVACGGDGVISVVANQIPGEFSLLVKEALAGHFEKAREIQYKMLNLMNLNFIESNPIPVKTSLALMGKVAEVFRLPLVKISEKNRSVLTEELKQLKLIV